MRRLTFTVPADAEAALRAYLRCQEAPPSTACILRAALTEYLAKRGFTPGKRRLRITPARSGSGAKDTSVAHDRHVETP